MRSLFLPFLFAAALAMGGCSSPQKKAAKMEREAIKQNSRLTEERRMRAMTHGEVQSARGAETVVWDPNKSFDPSRAGVGAARTFGSGGARTKDFNFQQKVRADAYVARDFRGTKTNAAADRKFGTEAAGTKGKYTIPNADKDAGSKTAATRELWDGNKVADTRDLHDGKRPYLGPESKNLGKAMDAKELANWRTGESVIYNNGTVERVSNLKQLSIEEVRELLNKNK